MKAKTNSFLSVLRIFQSKKEFHSMEPRCIENFYLSKTVQKRPAAPSMRTPERQRFLLMLSVALVL